jgi:membrane protein DedA with SNARE-associated domain
MKYINWIVGLFLIAFSVGNLIRLYIQPNLIDKTIIIPFLIILIILGILLIKKEKGTS